MFRLNISNNRSSRRARRRDVRPSLEALDDRVLLSAFTVTSVGDSGASLRQAILEANSGQLGFFPKIVFNLPPSATVHLASALPAITADNVTIDGDNGGKVFTIDGQGAGNAVGLNLAGSVCTLESLTLTHWNVAGICAKGSDEDIEHCNVYNSVVGFLDEGDNDKIDACKFGDFVMGVALGNGTGLQAYHSTDLSITNTNLNDNSDNGVEVDDSTGFRLITSFACANANDGVIVIGGSTPGTAQDFTTSIQNAIILGNGENGVEILGSSGNLVGGDLGPFSLASTAIGYSLGVNNPVGNFGDGVLIEGTVQSPSENNTVSECTIAGNHGDGVHITGPGSTLNTLSNNFIGIYFDNTNDNEFPPEEVLGNSGDGVRIDGGAYQNEVGGLGLFFNGQPSSGAGNIIVASGADGVGISGPGTSLNFVVGNMIGWVKLSNLVQPVWAGGNQHNGVFIAGGATHNYVGYAGGTAPSTGYGNVISFNSWSGVALDGTGTSSNFVVGNLIGSDDKGTTREPNLEGVTIDAGASQNRVGLPVTGLGNLISGNADRGVYISGAGTSHNVVQSNLIGTDRDGTKALFNGENGVYIVAGASNNVVGGADRPSMSAMAGNVISGNGDSGVVIDSSGTEGNVLAGNFIGTDLFGANALPNGLYGVSVGLSADGNTVGGTTADLGNVISGNTLAGVVVDASTNTTVVQMNNIGTDLSGQFSIGNGQDGVDLQGSHNTVLQNVISGNFANGMTVNGSFNTIQGNKIGTNIFGTAPPVANHLDGVDLAGSNNAVIQNVISGNFANGMTVNGSFNTIQGNKIGTNTTGVASVANHLDGVDIDTMTGPGNNTLGGTKAGQGNLISGNWGNGVRALGTTGTNNLILGNRIGTNVFGKLPVSNDLNGVLIVSATGYTVGGAGAGAGNLISGNMLNGIEITGAASQGIFVLGNKIGTDFSGQKAVANGLNGVFLTEGASDNTIGDTGPNAGNLISGNGDDGVLILGNISILGTGPLPHSNRLLGNRIGTDVKGETALPNQGQGVEIWLANANSVGGDTAGAGNLISGNAGNGVLIAGGANLNVVQGDLIGTDSDGSHPLANHGNGVEIDDATQTTIGGAPTTTSTPGNLISGNLLSGLVIQGTGSTSNAVRGNDIGTTRGAGAPLANCQDGVDILSGANHNVIGGIGGTGVGHPGNTIWGNKEDGVRIDGTGTDNNRVLGNAIGAYSSDGTGEGNGFNGVSIFDGAQRDAVEGNVIAYNQGAGVAIGDTPQDANTVSDPVLSNSIFGNVGQGIDLGSDGVTPNTPGSPHVGPNHFVSTPRIAGATYDSSSGTLTLQLFIDASVSSKFFIQVFTNPTAGPGFHGPGMKLLTQAVLSTGPSGSGTVTVTLSVPSSIEGQYLSATATDTSFDTSEFSQDYQVP
jgi:hypothetical protein